MTAVTMTAVTHPWAVTRGTCTISHRTEEYALDTAARLVACGHSVTVADVLNPDATTRLRPMGLDS